MTHNKGLSNISDLPQYHIYYGLTTALNTNYLLNNDVIIIIIIYRLIKLKIAIFDLRLFGNHLTPGFQIFSAS